MLQSYIVTFSVVHFYLTPVVAVSLGYPAVTLVEAHHIDYFTTSQNNDTTNIIIISPNYHRIIHKNNPVFNRKKFQFEFPNGELLK